MIFPAKKDTRILRTNLWWKDDAWKKLQVSVYRFHQRKELVAKIHFTIRQYMWTPYQQTCNLLFYPVFHWLLSIQAFWSVHLNGWRWLVQECEADCCLQFLPLTMFPDWIVSLGESTTVTRSFIISNITPGIHIYRAILRQESNCWMFLDPTNNGLTNKKFWLLVLGKILPLASVKRSKDSENWYLF